jgi:hypothetical protein
MLLSISKDVEDKTQDGGTQTEAGKSVGFFCVL